MNKLLKIVIGLTMALALVLGVGAFKASAATAPPQPLSIGASGVNVTYLQDALLSLGYSIPAGATGYFGLQTKAAVTAFQNTYAAEVLAPLGLTSGTGYYGALTAAKLAAVLAGGPVAVYPAGCTSSAGYSTTTGMPCTGGANLPAGCTSTVGYSPTTGVKCDSSSTTSGSTTLSGGAGSVSAYKLLSSPTNLREVGEGQNDVKIAGISIEADSGSDLALTAVKLNFSEGTATRDLDRYLSDVSVWLGSTEIARVDASDFTDTNDFDKTVSLKSGAIIKAGQIGNLYIAASGVDNLDSADAGDTWTIDVDSVRFVDAQGAVISEDPGTASRTFSAETFATASNVQLRLTENTGNPDISNVEVDDVNTTDGVLLVKGNLKATGSDIEIRELPVTLVSASAEADIDTIATNLILKINGDEIQSLDVGADCALDETPVTGANDPNTIMCQFDNVDTTISAGSTATVEIVADLNGTDDMADGEGSTLSATLDLDGSGAQGDVVARDESGEDVTDIPGSITGDTQTFLSTGADVKFISSSFTPENVTDVIDGTIKIKFSVRAFGDSDVTFDEDTFGSGAGLLDYVLTGPGSDNGGLIESTQTTSSAGIFTVTSGSTKEFTLSVKFSGTSGFTKLEIVEVDGTTVTNVKASY
jgi:hypothetical protein